MKITVTHIRVVALKHCISDPPELAKLTAKYLAEKETMQYFNQIPDPDRSDGVISQILIVGPDDKVEEVEI